MRRHVLTGLALLGSLLPLAACADASALEGNDTSKLVMAASTEYSGPDAERGNGKASIFAVPREAMIISW